MTTAIVGIHDGIRLHNGRMVTYASAGPDNGFPVVYCHGAVGSPRWRTPELDALVQRLGVRYLIVNRPGFAGSDPSPGRRVVDFAHDLAELMDRLGHDRFALVGVSAGAPYALACGWALPQRVAALAAVSPLGPPHGPGASLSLRYHVPLVVFGPHRAGSLVAGLCLRGLHLSSDTTPAAMIDDYVVCRQPWGFDPSEVQLPFTVWHGRDDRLVPLRHTLRFVAAIAQGSARVEPSAGHFFYRRRLAEIIPTLATPSETPERSTRDRKAA